MDYNVETFAKAVALEAKLIGEAHEKDINPVKYLAEYFGIDNADLHTLSNIEKDKFDKDIAKPESVAALTSLQWELGDSYRFGFVQGVLFALAMKEACDDEEHPFKGYIAEN